MDPIWLLLLLPLAAGSGWYAGVIGRGRRRGREKNELPSAYFRGLNFLLNEQHDKAIEVLVKALEQDDETVEVQLALGNLFRRRGEVERATRIHQNLVARTNLDRYQRSQALFELGQDYLKAGLLDRAENLLLEISETPEHREQAFRLLLQIYDQEKEWESAITVAAKLQNETSRNMSSIIAQYYCELAERDITEGRYRGARHFIEQAQQGDPRCVRAIIQSGRLEALHGNHSEAIREWHRVGDHRPAFLGEVLDLVANSYRALDGMEDYQRFLERSLERHPDVKVAMALVELLHERQGSDSAQNFLLSWVRSHPSLHGLYRLIQLRLKDSEVSGRSDLDLLAGMIGGIVGRESGYECRQCGFTGKSLHWQCPGCKGWNTTVPRKVSHQPLPVGAPAAVPAIGHPVH